MTRRKFTIAQRWQRMSNTGMSSRNIAVQFNVNHTVIGRLIQRYHQTGMVNDRPRSGRPRLTDFSLDVQNGVHSHQQPN